MVTDGSSYVDPAPLTDSCLRQSIKCMLRLRKRGMDMGKKHQHLCSKKHLQDTCLVKLTGALM